jgi:two-component system cell cycle response regulator
MGARILVIEDNPANLELMSYLLKAFGHEVLTAMDGETGLEIARREGPDLIVCDIQIPRLNGLEVARRLKSHPSLIKIPLVAVTAFAMVGDRDKVLSAGFDGYIAKPIIPDKFVPQVEAFLPGFDRITPEPPAPAPPTLQRRPDKRATIMVVDDSFVNIELARSILEPAGFEIVGARSVAEALELIGDVDPDLILSDVHMREATGFDLLRSLKADAVFSNIPFVFISSTVWREQDRIRGLEMGAANFILRPADPGVVLAEIERCLSQGTRHGDNSGGR